MVEIREIPGYPNYGISADGRVWSKRSRSIVLDDYKPDPMSTQFRLRYLWVKLRVPGKVHSMARPVHRLLYLAWVGPIPDGFQIDHIDGNRQNNSISNLEAVTPQENTRRAVKTGLWRSRVGDLNPNSRARRRDRMVNL